jgi:hypothetical protein
LPSKLTAGEAAGAGGKISSLAQVFDESDANEKMTRRKAVCSWKYLIK